MNIHWETLSPALLPQRRTAREILQQALLGDGPVTHLLESAATADEPVLVLVNDPHRSTQTRPALEVLAERITFLPSQRRPGPRFRVLVATGTHRFASQERREFEQATFTGCGLNIEEVTWHDATDEGSLAEIAGVRMHRCLAKSRFLLPIGSVEPHYFAGVTGPHKTVTIGCMAFSDIQRNHAAALTSSSDILRLQGNPVFESIVRVLHGLESSGKMIWAIGEVVCGDTLLAAATGDPISVIEALLPAVRRTYIRRIPQPVDLLRLRVPKPLGRNLYQADKALKNNHLAVRDGGGIVLEAECSDRIGPDAFVKLLRRCDDLATARQIVAQEGYRLGDHKAVRLRHLLDPAFRGVHVTVVSRHLTMRDCRGTGIEVFPEVQPALHWLTSVVTGPLDHGLIVEDAGMFSVNPAHPSPARWESNT